VGCGWGVEWGDAVCAGEVGVDTTPCTFSSKSGARKRRRLGLRLYGPMHESTRIEVLAHLTHIVFLEIVVGMDLLDVIAC